MPIYEFSCPIHGRFERIYSLKEFDNIKDGVLCEQYIDNGRNCFIEGEEYRCKRIATKEWSQLGLVSGISQTTPTTIFRNANNPNDIRVAVYKGQEVPYGYIKEELKTPMERSRVEKEMAKVQDAQDDFDTAKREYIANHVRKERHADLNARMNSLVKDAENPEQAKELLKSAMNRTNKKKIPRKKSQLHFSINHDNASNLTKG